MSSNQQDQPLNDMQKAQTPYRIIQKQLVDLVGEYKTRNFDEDIIAVDKLGGSDEIISMLKSDKLKGISDGDLMERTKYFGNNEREDLKAQSCLSMLWQALDDLMLKLLIVCSLVSITAEMLLAYNSEPCKLAIAWIDGFAIMVAVILVSGVGSYVDYRKEIRFVEKRNESNAVKRVNVIRNGDKPEPMHPRKLHVGDIVQITYGMSIPVDGLVITGSQISADESAMTGESDELRKAPQAECMERLKEAQSQHRTTQKIHGVRKHELPSPILQSGTSIAQGEGTFLCLMVGEESCLGKIMASMEMRDEKTPLQEKLEEMAEDIGKLGTIFAILTFHVLMIRFIFEGLYYKHINLFGIVPPKKAATTFKINQKKAGVDAHRRLFAQDAAPARHLAVPESAVCAVMRDSKSKNDKNKDKLGAAAGGDDKVDECSVAQAAPAYPKGCTDQGCWLEYVREWFEFLIIGIVIIVVAVPEGLPLAVMISLAFSIGAMLKDDCDVKKLASCEIMGGANNICSDKTGTLTNNCMETVRMWAGKDIKVPVKADSDIVNLKDLGISDNTIELLGCAVSCNVPDKCGPTDLAMTTLLQRAKMDTNTIRADHLSVPFLRFPFTSGRKRMSTVTINHKDLESGSYARLQIKGASEIICRACTHFIDEDGVRKPRTDSKFTEIAGKIESYAKEALRTVALGYKDIKANEFGERHDEPGDEAIKDIEKNDFTLVAILGIEDTIRDTVPAAVLAIQKAGVTVRMVTGDNIDTARAIAVKCNIITQDEMDKDTEGVVCMEGPVFNERCKGLRWRRMKNGKMREEVTDMEEFKSLRKTLKVLARSRPEDKYLIVTGLRNVGDVVAVTGDGTNDAPALKKADVGFGMGIAGTDVCLEAADIIIVNDDFERIVRAARWGRNVYDNIQRFLRFQLTVNFVALTVTFIGSAGMKQSPVNAIQLLWVNLIMDSLAAMALATGSPGEELLQRAPQNRDDYLVSRRMVKHIQYGSIWQSIILIAVAFAGEYFIYEPNALDRFERVDNGPWIYPGRNKDWDGSDLFEKWKDPVTIYRSETTKAESLLTETQFDSIKDKLGCDMDFLVFPGGYPKHFTFFFNLFVLMQVVNMVCARKIHDEWNIFAGFFDNFVFLGVWIVILGLQIVIIQFSDFIFKVQALAWEQWAIGFAISFTVFMVDAVTKLIPDRYTYAVGKDTVFDKREMAAGRAAEAKFLDSDNEDDD